MSELSDKVLEETARTCHLQLEDEERERIRSGLERILTFVENLYSVDTSQVEPLISPLDAEGFMPKVLLEEGTNGQGFMPREELNQKAVFQNAPDHMDAFFCVPKVIS